MKIVYIAHPISGDIMGNTNRIIQIVHDINLTRLDVVPFAPYLVDVLAMDDNDPQQRSRGIENDIAILKSGAVNELWIYGPKISGGMEAEIDLAYALGIPILVMDPTTEVPVHLRMIMNIGY